jgi:hypothetical protein
MMGSGLLFLKYPVDWGVQLATVMLILVQAGVVALVADKDISFVLLYQRRSIWLSRHYAEMHGDVKTNNSLTLICYCHLVGMAKIVRGSTFVRP